MPQHGRMARLPPVLDTDDLPLAELCAARLDGDLWEVTRRHEDGSLTVRHLAHQGTLRLPADYVTESVELAYFGIMEHALGQGVGRWFLGAAIDAAWSTGPEIVTVQTCTLDHPAALPLYQKLGFSPVGQSRELVKPMGYEERAASVMRD